MLRISSHGFRYPLPLVFFFALAAACTSEKVSQRPESRQDSPATSPTPGVQGAASTELKAQQETQLPGAEAETSEFSAPLSPALADAPPTEASKETAQPVLTAPDGTLLPQTEERPTLDSNWFIENGVKLFSAIVHDDAEAAQSFFFPKLAYAQVKAIADPDRDYEGRLLKAFKSDIHKYHQALGAQRHQTTFVELRVYEPGAKWVKPGQEGNRIGYFRVLRSVIVYRDAQERVRELALHTMISWRGEWYVIHLGPLK